MLGAAGVCFLSGDKAGILERLELSCKSEFEKMGMILQLFGVHQLCALLYDFVRGGVGHKKAGRRLFLLKSDQSVEVSGNLV